MDDGRYSRQAFLGPHAQERFARCRVGIVGLGGGGSHVVQQLAHLGFLDYTVYDPDVVTDVNLNRLIGAIVRDVRVGAPKVDVARRVIKALQPRARVDRHRLRWQDDPAPLRLSTIIIGCVDGLAERRELEASCRRYLIPYIDIGLDVHQAAGWPPVMAGQVILSMPGGPCMTCLGFLTEKTLAGEAARYGVAGPRPQVVWANGILASSAVGVAVDLLTDWTRSLRSAVYLDYRANEGLVLRHVRLSHGLAECSHYPAQQVGPPRFSNP